MSSPNHWLCVPMALLLAIPAFAGERTWTNVDGFEMKAEFVREVDGVVTFLKGGKLISMPLDKLSEKDQQIIRDIAMGKPLPEEEESAPEPTKSSPAESEPNQPKHQAGHARGKVTPEERSWKDTSGKRTYAKFVRVVGNEVVLIRTNKVIRISFFSLSEEDQEYVRDILTQQGKEDQIPGGAGGGGNETHGEPGDITAPDASTDARITGPPDLTGDSPGRPRQPGRGRRPDKGPSGIGGPRFPGSSAGVGTGGFPETGIPGPRLPMGGIPGGTPSSAIPPEGSGAVGLGGSSHTSGPPLAPMGFPDSDPPVPGTGPMPPPGLIPEAGPGASPGLGYPSHPQTPDIAGMASALSPSVPNGPTATQGYHCSGCKREITEAESSLTKCPHCGTIWLYKEDGTGNKQYSGIASPRSMAVGLLVVVGIIVLGAVGGFIGIVAAIVRTACKPPPTSSYRRY